MYRQNNYTIRSNTQSTKALNEKRSYERGEECDTTRLVILLFSAQFTHAHAQYGTSLWPHLSAGSVDQASLVGTEHKRMVKSRLDNLLLVLKQLVRVLQE